MEEPDHKTDTEIEDYLLRRMSDDEARSFERRLETDASLRKKLDFHRTLKEAASELHPSTHDTSFGWARLSRTIDAETEQRSGSTQTGNNKSLSTLISPASWRIAAVAAVALVIGNIAPFSLIGVSEPAMYIPVAQETPNAMVNIVFADEAAAADISALLQELNLQIQTGPSALGVYGVTFDNEQSAEDVIAALKEESALVTIATPAN